MSVPANFKYTKDHEWAKVDGNVATIGITAFACEQLGDIVFVELPKVGDQLKAGNTFGVVESTKAVSDLFAPVTGKIVATNGPVTDSPETINVDPYEKGWLVKVELANAAELDGLMDAMKYEEHVKASGH